MPLTDATKLVDINTTEDILEALTVLSGAAIVSGNELLWFHIRRVEALYRNHERQKRATSHDI